MDDHTLSAFRNDCLLSGNALSAALAAKAAGLRLVDMCQSERRALAAEGGNRWGRQQAMSLIEFALFDYLMLEDVRDPAPGRYSHTALAARGL